MSTDKISVLVCRGCCCGTTEKHPELDHEAQLDRIRAAVAVAPNARLWTVDCLGPCERSNVVVVRRDATRRWFGELLSESLTEELSRWIVGGARAELDPAVAACRFEPDAQVGFRVDRLHLDGEQLAHLATGWLESAAGSWSIGVQGAVGEFDPGRSPAVTVRRDGHTTVIEAYGHNGALRLAIDDDTPAFAVRPRDDKSQVRSVILAGPRSGRSPRRTIRELGPDPRAMSDDATGQVCFDMGVGHDGMTFAVRTASHRLIEILRRSGGWHWTEMMARYQTDIIDLSPTRIVSSGECREGECRVEVYSPIPAPGGRSSDGSHTHLLAAELELGRELPVGVALHGGLRPLATFHPIDGTLTGL